MDYPNITDPQYKPDLPPETGTVKVYNDMVHSYLNLVQPNAFPPAFINQLIQQIKSGSVSSVPYREILVYEVGYLVAIAIGVLFIIFMPLVGFCFSCCRCCGNCGGKMYQKQTTSHNCKRRFLYTFLFIITLIILAGDICAFYSNSKMTTAVNDGFSSFNNTMDNLKTYVNSVPKEVDTIINASDIPIEKANNSIINIGPILGGMILGEIGKTANATLNAVVSMTNDLNTTATYMTAINNSFNALQEEQKIISQNLTLVQKSINDTLNTCGPPCDPAPSVDGLTLDAHFDTIPDFSDQMKQLRDFLDSGIDSTIEGAYKSLRDIPETVTNQTKSTVSDVQDQLVKIKKKISDTRDNIPIVDTLQNVNDVFDSVSSNSASYKKQIVDGDNYRWIVGICICCVILLVVVCNLFGLLLGPCGHRAKADPTDRNCASNSGGDFFMAGASFSFIFSWLLMIVVTVLFIIGGNSYTLVCKPWGNQQLYKFLDSPEMKSIFNLSDYINGTNISISTLYSDCQKNNSLWSTLDLGKMFNLDDYLNISKYTGDVTSTIDKTQINLTSIQFMNDDQKQQAQDVSSSGIDTLDFTNITQQMAKNTTKTDLGSFADQLDELAKKTGVPDTKLKEDANKLREIQASINSKLVPEVLNINRSINNLKAISKTLLTSLNNTLKQIADAQTFVDTKAVEIVKNASKIYLNKLLDYFNLYIIWAKTMLTQNLARCGPVSRALDSAQVILCSYVVDSLNAFWFSLGWCTIFFIPSIILSVKLAKYYRRMKTSDVHVDHADHLEMTSTSQQFLIPRVTTKS
ncbi:prominin-1-A-like [Discoglossus pictus]